MRSRKFLLKVPRHEQREILHSKIEAIHEKRNWKLVHNLNGMSIKQLEKYLGMIEQHNLRVVK